MRGLEAVEIKLSELERTSRIDSEFYKKENLTALSVLDKTDHVPLTDFFTVSDGNHMSISHDFREEGVRYYRGGDSHSFFIEESNPVCIGRETYDLPTMKRSHLSKDDLLISIVGTIGNICIVRTDAAQTCNCKLAILRPKQDEKTMIAAVFLKGKYGQNQIQKFKRGAVQMGFLLEDMSQIIIPVFSENFCNRIEQAVRQMDEALKSAANAYLDAEKFLLAELGLTTFAPSNEPVTVKSFSDSFGTSERLDAEYYQPKYESYHQIIAGYNHGTTTVGMEFDMVKTSSNKTKGCYPYIEIGDINVGDGSFMHNYVLTEELPANAKIHVSEGDLLISKVRPYRGAVAVIDREIDDLIVSGAFTVLREKSNYPKETLAVLLRSSLYKDWLLKWNVGSSYPVIKDDDVLGMLIPNLPSGVHDVVKLKINKSQGLRRQSEQLLEMAKRAVEIAIESGEEKAMKFINSGTAALPQEV